jgi:hypothetical protein
MVVIAKPMHPCAEPCSVQGAIHPSTRRRGVAGNRFRSSVWLVIQKRMYVRLTIRIPPRRLCTLCRQVGWSKRRRVASEFGVRSWWPGRSEVPFRPSSTASIFCRLATVYHSTYSVYFCNYTSRTTLCRSPCISHTLGITPTRRQRTHLNHMFMHHTLRHHAPSSPPCTMHHAPHAQPQIS